MATIKTAIQMVDRLSSPMRAMNNAVSMMVNSFEHLNTASGNAMDTSSIELARRELARAESEFNSIEQEIQQADNAQKRLNSDINGGTSAASGFLGKVMAVAATYLGLQAVGNVLGLSDELTNTTARLNMMNDGLQTTVELQQMIFDSAERSRSSYSSMADLVAKISLNASDAFGSNAEAVAFAELLNKQFVIAGTNTQNIEAATLQLIQALGSGVLRGEELNSIFEASPNIIQTIADYLGVGIGEIRNMASEGQITADIVKTAMFSAANDINSRFSTMPQTWGQIWTSFKNEAIWAFKDVLEEINNIANSETFQSFVDEAKNSLYTLAAITLIVLQTFSTIGGFIYDNWSLIGPIVGTATATIVAYGAALLIAKAASVVAVFWTGAQTLAFGLLTASSWAGVKATLSLTGAQWGLNAALMANPIFIVILLIIALIGVIYLAVGIINHFAGTSVSATGIIAGAFMVLGTHIYNVIVFWWNLFASLMEFSVNSATHGTYAVKRLFYNMASSVIDQIVAMSSGWDSFATSFVNAMISAVNGAIRAWNKFIDILPTDIASAIGLGKGAEYAYSASITSDLKGAKAALKNWVGETPANYWEAPKMDAKSLGGAWDIGYNWGSNIMDSFDLGKQGNQASDSLQDIMNGLGGIGSGINDLAGSGGDTAGNTAKMAKEMEGSSEDLKYLRDIAEREVINRFTTAKVVVDTKIDATVASNMDLDGIVDYLGGQLEETLTSTAEGV